MNEERIARVEGEIEQLAKTLGALAKTVEVGFRDLNVRLESVSLHSQPDISKIFALILQCAAFFAFVIAAVATPIAYHFNDSIQGLDHKLQKEYQLVNDTQKERQNSLTGQIAELDTRLQREFNVANASIKETAEALTVSSANNQKTISDKLDQTQNLVMSQIKLDLEELRQRRMKDK